MLSVTQDYVASKDWMIVNNELKRLRKEARLVLALDKRSVQLAEYDDVVLITYSVASILWYTLHEDLHILKSTHQTYLQRYFHSAYKSSWYGS
jgi:hypothetical protein